ncbi:hypothetical protein EI94DRAFT_1797594 [Lactarius quietus]|nr:hypothetical protein EI94DRAFT_1797594 [Lactarius quietus]
MPVARTSPTRQDNQFTLSYYQSSLADQPYMVDQETEQLDELNSSHGVDSSPLPSFANGTRTPKDDDLGSTTSGTARHRRKHMITENGAHNRRAAIVPLEVNALKEQGHLPSSAAGIVSTLPLRSRGLVVEAQLANSALVVPPDTSPVHLHDIPFSSLTPSSPSPVSPTTPSVVRSPSSSSQAEYSRKARTTSHTKSSSRDIGIVGTRRDSPRELATVSVDTPSELKPPIFQTPALRSSSPHIFVTTDTGDSDSSAQHIQSNVSYAPPSAMSASVEPMHSVSPLINGLTGYTQPHSIPPLVTSSSRHQGISTPEQGQVSPSSACSMSSTPSSYLHYQPGIHSKAGPLPPPPRAMFDIDFNAPPPPRPPRLRSPSPLTAKRSPRESTTPTSVTLRLTSKTSVTSIHHKLQISSTPPSSNESSSSDSSVYSPEPEPVPTSTDVAVNHTREGAFPPSTILVAPPERQQSLTEISVKLVAELPSKDQLPDLPKASPDASPSVVTQQMDDDRDPTTAQPPELRRERSWVSSLNESSSVSSENGRRAFEDARPDLPQESNGSCPSIREFPPEDGLSSSPRRGVLTSLKRYSSLPRTPSRSPRSPRMSIFTRSSSPESPSRPRIRARSPDAMQFKDVLSKKTSLERAIGYANKINELYMYDCGLGDWVVSMKEKGISRTRLVSPIPEQSDSLLVPRARHTSRASISSEMTFPLRGDAYIATDLSQRDIDTLPSPNAPPSALPYPALAGVQPTINFRHSTMMGSPLSYGAPLSTAGTKATGGFFASLGRNSSTRKDSITHANSIKPSTSHARLTKPPPATAAPNPRPVQITSAPSVPGGPRALPSRMQRSRTLMLAPSSPSSESTSPSPPIRRRSNTLKRPSFFGRSPGPSPDLEAKSASTEFTQQVEKLAELLPHADKDVLSGYLRRAGQDILAIGQYLEDEKNGSLRRD